MTTEAEQNEIFRTLKVASRTKYYLGYNIDYVDRGDVLRGTVLSVTGDGELAGRAHDAFGLVEFTIDPDAVQVDRLERNPFVVVAE